MKNYQFYEMMKGRLCGLVGSVLVPPYSKLEVCLSEGVLTLLHNLPVTLPI